jgi:hypothetical protein
MWGELWLPPDDFYLVLGKKFGLSLIGCGLWLALVHYSMMIAEQLVPSSHFSQQHTVVHSLEMPNEVKDRLLE